MVMNNNHTHNVNSTNLKFTAHTPGAALFGAGWGLDGTCPGPAITRLGAAPMDPLVLTFMATMMGGLRGGPAVAKMLRLA